MDAHPVGWLGYGRREGVKAARDGDQVPGLIQDAVLAGL
jgi:hypothetical protein